MAMDFATQGGVSEEPREVIYLQPLESKAKFVELGSPAFVFRNFQ